MSHAETFHALHKGPDILILANAWDAGSARMIETQGAKAIATSSAAVAWAHGYADGHHLPVDVLVTAVREIARVISVPLSVDCEGGYADGPAQAAANIARVIDAGAIGCNIEDGTDAPETLAAKIEAVRAVADRAGVKFFINARTDVYLKNLAQGDAALAETVRRGKRYVEAGADGFFVPWAADVAVFETVAREVGAPINAISRKGGPGFAALKAAGVRRLSAGTAVARAAMEATRSATAAFLASGDSDGLVAAGGAPSDINALFKDR
jgi:2-methylisocitrate lyase-like PEP mutase family enzyme